MKKTKYFIGDNVSINYEIDHICDPQNTVVLLHRSVDDSLVIGTYLQVLHNKIVVKLRFPIRKDEYYLVVLQDEEGDHDLQQFIKNKGKTEKEAIEALEWMWS